VFTLRKPIRDSINSAQTRNRIEPRPFQTPTLSEGRGRGLVMSPRPAALTKPHAYLASTHTMCDST